MCTMKYPNSKAVNEFILGNGEYVKIAEKFPEQVFAITLLELSSLVRYHKLISKIKLVINYADTRSNFMKTCFSILIAQD